jgi:MOSC domain-containing protein YiiM
MIADEEEIGFKTLFNNYPQHGKIDWIGLRPEKRKPIEVVNEAEIGEKGIIGDRASKNSFNNKRQVTLIQKEHLDSVASFLGKEIIDPSLIRRNVVVSGINLFSLKNKKIIIGEAELEMTGFCYPCSRMEENLGKGGFNAMRGHGGITCRVIKPGKIKIGDIVISSI